MSRHESWCPRDQFQWVFVGEGCERRVVGREEREDDGTLPRLRNGRLEGRADGHCWLSHGGGSVVVEIGIKIGRGVAGILS